MKIAILSRQPRSYSTRRLREAARKRGHTAQVLDTLKFTLMLEHQDPDLLYKNRHTMNFDAVIPRIGAAVTFFGLAVLRQFEQMGVYSVNDSVAIARSRDKLRAMQVLSRYDVGIPSTAFVRNEADILPAIKRVGGVPVIIKVLEGTQGIGVILAETQRVAEAIIQTLQSAKQNVLIQKFVAESQGRDLRALVVGDRVVGAMRRSARAGEFRSNVHRGGRVEGVVLEPEYERTALRAAQIIGLRVAGVDMLETNEGPQVLEVNSSPGLEGIEGATGIDIADAIIEDCEHHVLFPDVDVRQRLRLTGGYGVAEFQVYNMPALEGKTIVDSPLPGQGIWVMSMMRDNEVIARPKGEDVIHRGDTLLCYGELRELRQIVPQLKNRRRPRRGKSASEQPTKKRVKGSK